MDKGLIAGEKINKTRNDINIDIAIENCKNISALRILAKLVLWQMVKL